MARQLYCVALLALLAVASASSTAAASASLRNELIEELEREHGVRQSKRMAPASVAHEDLVLLLMRSMDKNHDKMLDEADVAASTKQLRQHLPEVSKKQFMRFLQHADINKDGKTNREEMLNAVGALVGEGSLLETDSTKPGLLRRMARKAGNFIKKGVKAVANKIKSKLGMFPTIDTTQDGCIMCQYIVERVEKSVKAAGLWGEQPLMIEESATIRQIPDVGAAQQISASRISTRQQRDIERQRYNQIYRVMDVTLDDVCEQAMPNAYYGYCKAVYQTQATIVDGLRYQYRPADICYRVGICAANSYITNGIHGKSRYPSK